VEIAAVQGARLLASTAPRIAIQGNVLSHPLEGNSGTYSLGASTLAGDTIVQVDPSTMGSSSGRAQATAQGERSLSRAVQHNNVAQGAQARTMPRRGASLPGNQLYERGPQGYEAYRGGAVGPQAYEGGAMESQAYWGPPGGPQNNWINPCWGPAANDGSTFAHHLPSMHFAMDTGQASPMLMASNGEWCGQHPGFGQQWGWGANDVHAYPSYDVQQSRIQGVPGYNGERRGRLRDLVGRFRPRHRAHSLGSCEGCTRSRSSRFQGTKRDGMHPAMCSALSQTMQGWMPRWPSSLREWGQVPLDAPAMWSPGYSLIGTQGHVPHNLYTNQWWCGNNACEPSCQSRMDGGFIRPVPPFALGGETLGSLPTHNMSTAGPWPLHTLYSNAWPVQPSWCHSERYPCSDTSDVLRAASQPHAWGYGGAPQSTSPHPTAFLHSPHIGQTGTVSGMHELAPMGRNFNSGQKRMPLHESPPAPPNNLLAPAALDALQTSPEKLHTIAANGWQDRQLGTAAPPSHVDSAMYQIAKGGMPTFASAAAGLPLPGHQTQFASLSLPDSNLIQSKQAAKMMQPPEGPWKGPLKGPNEACIRLPWGLPPSGRSTCSAFTEQEVPQRMNPKPRTHEGDSLTTSHCKDSVLESHTIHDDTWVARQVPVQTSHSFATVTG
jgi:hypothetical protein